MGAARKLSVVMERPTGADLAKLLDRLRVAEREQAAAEERHVPTARAWLEAQAADARANWKWWEGWRRMLRANAPKRARLKRRQDALGAARAETGRKLNEETERHAASAAALEALRREVASLRSRLGEVA